MTTISWLRMLTNPSMCVLLFERELREESSSAVLFVVHSFFSLQLAVRRVYPGSELVSAAAASQKCVLRHFIPGVCFFQPAIARRKLAR